MPIQTPLEVLTPTRRECDGERVIRQPLGERQNERRGCTPTFDRVDQIHSVVEEEVGVQPFAVLVNQLCEAEASPISTPLV